MVQYASQNYRTLAVGLVTAACTLTTIVTLGSEVKGNKPMRPPRTAPAVRVLKVGVSVEGRTIDLQIFGSGPAVVLIIASIHGDEAAGTPLVARLAAHLRANPDWLDGNQVLIMPNANPDGVAHRQRNNNHGVDLNRNFPAGNWTAQGRHGRAPLSEPESRAIQRVLHIYRPQRIVSIHQPLACIDYDGPGRGLAEAMAEHMPLAVRRLGGRPGSLGSYVGGELGIPIITLELPRAADNLAPQELWRRYGRGLRAWISHPIDED